MKITITKKNRGHIIDVLHKFFKHDDIVRIDPSCDQGIDLLCIDYNEITYDDSGLDLYIHYNYIKDTILKTYHLFIPYNSKIELKGTMIKLKLVDHSSIRNQHIFRIIAQTHNLGNIKL